LRPPPTRTVCLLGTTDTERRSEIDDKAVRHGAESRAAVATAAYRDGQIM
jgi:hypothetical protein